MFIPVTPEEVIGRGWDGLDVILISGDTYADTSYNGSAVIGQWLIENGFRVGMIAQPDVSSEKDITRLGEPLLFWSISAGCVDSMVANYSATRKRRKDDDFTPGGVNDRRPDRACIAYSNLIRKYFKQTKPIVLGGIEASLRRIAHYDMWSDSVRRSVLFDSKADIITYGMSELSNLELANALRDGTEWRNIRGICYASKERKDGYLVIPSFDLCSADNNAFINAFKMFSDNCDPLTSGGLMQAHGDRWLIHNSPSRHLPQKDLDRIYELDYENKVHPYYLKDGAVRSMETIKQSVTTHRGCYGECNFCAVSVHQGRTVISRSADSILREIERMASRKGFNGIIYDVGGPTANMYGIECLKKSRVGKCKDRRCLYPKICERLSVNHEEQIRLLENIKNMEGVKKVFITSGVRYDLILSDKCNGKAYLDHLVKENISGQLKIAPEHISDDVVRLMGKPGKKELLDFKRMFDESNREHNKKQFLTYYLMAAHPGCYERHMEELRRFVTSELRTNPEQVQIFTPTPSTFSTMMYHTRRNIENNTNLKVEKSMQMKQKQKDIILQRQVNSFPRTQYSIKD
ncbi:MAG: YgiQ family radical SAM protein [Methanomassiliicoccaceae archaeon]|nr:YgiQ family radical SAM protein [Methanomassiliicoccaceae archaeon]